MKRLFLFLGTIALVSVITMHLQAEYKKEHRLPPKLYKVELSVEQWEQKLQILDAIKTTMRISNLPSNQVAFYSDSLITPFQIEITKQIKNQLAQEQSAQQKKDSTKPKK